MHIAIVKLASSKTVGSSLLFILGVPFDVAQDMLCVFARVTDLSATYPRLQLMFCRLPLRDAFAQHLVEQRFVDELSGMDRLIHFLRGAGEIDQELITVHAIFAVRAE